MAHDAKATPTLAFIKCPRCGSPSPKLHPAVQLGGEVEICAHDFHVPLTESARDQLDRKAAADIARFFLGNDSRLAEDIRTGRQTRHFVIDVIRNRRESIDTAQPASAVRDSADAPTPSDKPEQSRSGKGSATPADPTFIP